MPDFKSEIRTSLAALNLSPTREEEIVEELSQDLQERFEEALSHGASEDEAKQLALNELTFPESIDNELKRVEQPVRSTELAIGAKKTRNQFAGFWDDIRFGLRMLRKQPGFAVVVILTLGIGIGATTAMLSVVQDVLIRPLPYAHSDRLYAIWASSESTGQTQIAASGPDFVDYLEQTDRLLTWRNICRVLHSPGLAMANRSWSIALRLRKIFSHARNSAVSWKAV